MYSQNILFEVMSPIAKSGYHNFVIRLSLKCVCVEEFADIKSERLREMWRWKLYFWKKMVVQSFYYPAKKKRNRKEVFATHINRLYAVVRGIWLKKIVVLWFFDKESNYAIASRWSNEITQVLLVFFLSFWCAMLV